MIGCTLAELHLRERYSINISRIWRDDFEFVPHGTTTLEFGDTIRIVGNRSDCESFTPVVGHQEERLHETQFMPLTLGLLTGVLLGFLQLPLPSGLSVSLGLAGGPLLSGLVVGHFGRIGPLTFRVPVAAKYFIRELGLLFFLAGAGVEAGHAFWPELRQQGPVLLLVGAAVTLAPMIAAYSVARLVLRWDALTAMGSICGAMTCTPGLGAVSRMARSQAGSLAYVAVYPTARSVSPSLRPSSARFWNGSLGKHRSRNNYPVTRERQGACRRYCGQIGAIRNRWLAPCLLNEFPLLRIMVPSPPELTGPTSDR